MKVCMVAYTNYDADNRVRRYAEALAKRGDEVDVFVLRRIGQPKRSDLNGVNVHRIQYRIVNENRPITYLLKITIFMIMSGLYLTANSIKKRYEIIHVHSIPDFLVFATFIQKLLGSKIILDIHDIIPEFYASKFNNKNDSVIVKSLMFVEKISIAFSDHVIISNHIWYETLLSRSVHKNKCSVILNYPDLNIFNKTPRVRIDNKFIMLYPGSMNWHQGLDVAIRAFAKIAPDYPNAEFHFIGEGSEKPALVALVKDLKLENRIIFKESVPMEEIAKEMSEADIGVVPKRAVSFGNEAFSTKIPEFMAIGVPIIASSTKIDRLYFKDTQIMFFKSEDVDDLAQQMKIMVEGDELRNMFVRNGYDYVKANNWDIKKEEYFDLINSLLH